jgi:hypothetical protein
MSALFARDSSPLGLGWGGGVTGKLGLELTFGRQRFGLWLNGCSGLSELGRLGSIHKDRMGLRTNAPMPAFSSYLVSALLFPMTHGQTSQFHSETQCISNDGQSLGCATPNWAFKLVILDSLQTLNIRIAKLT